MARWLLPALLVAGQLLYWPILYRPELNLLRGDPVPAVSVAGVAAACLITGAALGWRRERPIQAFAVVLAGYLLAALAVPDGLRTPAEDETLIVISVAPLIAVFSVAVRESARVTAAAFGVGVLCEAVLVATGPTGRSPFDLLLTVVLEILVYGLIAILGRRRARWHTERAAAARRLAAARQAGQDAAVEERRRLARELHDVTAHHLTSIVVNSSAAEMLSDQRPDLRAEALGFAARTGRDTLDALARLVAIMPAVTRPVTEPSLADLAGGFRELGQRITLDLPGGDPPPEIAAVVYGIAREALTNTLRYAPGGAVRIRYAGEELLIDDDGGTAGTPAGGLGGGRGTTGMRDRALAAGGTCEAGPRPDGGWRVRAVLPRAGAVAGTTPPTRSGRFLTDGMWILLLSVTLLAGIGMAVDVRLGPAATALLLMALAAHTVPLLWRRRAAWPVAAATALTGGLAPLLVVTGVVPAADAYVFVVGAGADLAAVYAVAVWGPRPALSSLAVPVVALPGGLVLALLLVMDTAADPEFRNEPAIAHHVTAVVLTLLMTFLLALPAAICWGIGSAVRRRRDRLRLTEEGGVAAALEQAADRARRERLRIAAGLHEAVLRHAADVPGAADRGDLPGVLRAARQALGAMRALLDGLGSRPDPGSVPQEVPSSRSE